MPENFEPPIHNPFTEKYKSDRQKERDALAKAQRTVEADMRKMVAHDFGRRTLRRIYKITGAASTTERRDKENRVDTYAMALAEGKRQVWLEIMSWLHKQDLLEVFSSDVYKNEVEEDTVSEV